MKTRKEIEEKYKWDLTKLCADDQDFYARLEKIKDYMPKFKEFEGKLNNKDSIWEYLCLDRKFTMEVEPLVLYSQLKGCEVLSDSKTAEMGEQISYILNEFSVETSFASSELHKLPDSMLDEIIADKKFKDYDRTFYQIKRGKKHILSKAEEKLLSGMDFLSGFSNNMDMLSDVDLQFGSIKDSKGKSYELNQSSYSTLVRSDDRKLRKLALTKLNKTFGKFINTFASNYISEVKVNCYFAKIRKYKSSLESALFEEEIDKKVYDMLMQEVNKNLDVLFDYFEIKRKILGINKMFVYDCMADIGKMTTKTYTYEEAMEIIKKALAPLGEEYVDLLTRAQKERWIDVMPNKDKASGAFQTGIYGFAPYVLTNFEGNLDSIFTLAHELGHAMHTYFSNKNQPMEKASYPIFSAEIASITNEMLLINYLLSNAESKDEKIALYNKLFDEVKGSIFRQTMFSEFEEKVHAMQEKGEPLTKDKLCQLYYFLNKKYYGTVALVEELKYEWARIPHFFSGFYVYKYATGMICAISFANRILSKEEGALEDYFKFLSSGDSKPPIETLSLSGCNLNDKKTFEQCFDYLKTMLKNWQEIV